MDPSSHNPSPPAARIHPLMHNDRIDQVGWRSFPASDPSPWIFGRGRNPRAHQDDPDGGDNRERARRRRHVG